jgi:UDP-glucose 4-epimerase
VILLRSEASTHELKRLVAIFGAGLIGAATARALGRHLELHRQDFPLDWQDAALRGRQLDALENDIAPRLESRAAGSAARLDVLWSAGRAGFAARPEETAGELASFREVLNSVVRLASIAPERVAVHLVSSAGGLFEGQRRVGPAAVPTPLRPYSELKHEQERLLATAAIRGRAYRLSSVYGFVRPGQRIGLISTLLLNGIRHQVTHISGRMSTLRDFVFVDDVAGFLARAIHDEFPERTSAPVLLAQGKPSSIWEIQRLVEKVVGHRAYVSYSLLPENSEDTTFSTAALPAGWQPSDLPSNVRRIFREALRSGAAFSPLRS